MDAGVAAFVSGLAGALLGAAATLLGARYNARKNAELSERDARENAELSALERSQDAYDRARRALLRVHNRRKRMRHPELEPMELQLFLNDLFDAQHGLSMVLVVCGEDQKETLRNAIVEFDELVDDLIRRPTEQQTGADEAIKKVKQVRETLRRAQDDDLAARRR